MAKKKTKTTAAQQAAQELQTATENTATEVSSNDNPIISDFNAEMMPKMSGLDANHQVDLLNGLKTFFKDDPNAVKHTGLSQEIVDRINGVTAIGYATVMVHECLTSNTPFAMRMRLSQIKALKEIAPEIGFRFNDNLLPAPNENGVVEVPSTAIEVSKETKKKHDDEKKVLDSKPILDPTKITNKEEERNALIAILGDLKIARPVDRIMKAINFKTAIMQIAASKLSDDEKEKELDRIKSLKTAEVFRDIVMLIGPSTFSTSGLSNFIFNQTAMHQNPILAFCLLRKASFNKEKNTNTFDDATIADIVKVLVYWHALTTIDENDRCIKDAEKRIQKRTAELKKAKASSEEIKKANEEDTEIIDKSKANIAYMHKIDDLTNNPSGEFVDNYIDIFNDTENKSHVHAHFVASNICSCYMPEIRFSKNNMTIETESVNKEDVLHNIQQYCGMIINLFREAGAALTRYSEGNLVSIEVEAEKEESKN